MTATIYYIDEETAGDAAVLWAVTFKEEVM